MKKLFFFFLSLIFSACIFSNEKSNEQKKVPVFDSCLVQARRSWCEDLNRCAETCSKWILLRGLLMKTIITSPDAWQVFRIRINNFIKIGS